VSAIQRYEEALLSLGRGDEVGVAEMLKQEAVANAELVEKEIPETPSGEPGSTEEQVQALLAIHDEANERFIALGFAVIEHGSERLLSILTRSLAHVIIRTAPTGSSAAVRPAIAAVVGGRLLWALGTYALGCDRLEALVALGRITVRVPHNVNESMSVFGQSEFRYPQALGGNAGRSYEHYLSWLRERRLVQDRLPMFAAVLEEVFAETDLLLALCMIGYLNRRTYSGGVARGTIHRLAHRFSDSAQRPALAALFESRDSELNNRVDECYRQHLEYDRNRLWRDDLPETFFSSS
jgi:hypothetical protein